MARSRLAGVLSFFLIVARQSRRKARAAVRRGEADEGLQRPRRRDQIERRVPRVFNKAEKDSTTTAIHRIPFFLSGPERQPAPCSGCALGIHSNVVRGPVGLRGVSSGCSGGAHTPPPQLLVATGRDRRPNLRTGARHGIGKPFGGALRRRRGPDAVRGRGRRGGSAFPGLGRPADNLPAGRIFFFPSFLFFFFFFFLSFFLSFSFISDHRRPAPPHRRRTRSNRGTGPCRERAKGRQAPCVNAGLIFRGTAGDGAIELWARRSRPSGLMADAACRGFFGRHDGPTSRPAGAIA